MNSKSVNEQSTSAGYARDASPLRAKLMPAWDAYDKENIPNPKGAPPKFQIPKASARLSLPLNLSTSVDRSPLQDRSQLAAGSNGPLPRRGRVTDGGATYDLTASGAGDASRWKTPEKRSASVAEMEDVPSPSKRPRQDGSEPYSFVFENWALAEEDTEKQVASDDEGLETEDVATLRANNVADIFPVVPNPRPSRRRAITYSNPSGVDAHFGAAWDEVMGRAAVSTSGYTHIPAFEDDDVFGDSYHAPLGSEDEQGDQTTAGLSSHESGGKNATIEGDIPEGDNRVNAVDAAAVPDADGVDESLLPLPVLLALRAYHAIEPYMDRCPPPQLMEESSSRLLASTSPVAHGAELDAPSPPPAEEKQKAVISLPVGATPAASPEVAQLPKAKTGRMTRSAQIRSDLTVRRSQAAPLHAPATLEVELQTPQPPKAQKTLPSGAMKTGRRVEATHDPSVASVQPVQLATPQVSANLVAPRRPEAKGAKTMRKPKVPQARSNGIVGSGIAGPSNSTPVAQTVYPPALAQEIWDLAEAGKYLEAHRLFPAQDKSIRIDGEAEVQKYLRDHPEAGTKLKPLTNGGPRKKLYLCAARAFWVPIEQKEGEKKNGPRDFVLEYNTTNCPYGYATPDNYQKHVYKFHLKKTYENYPKKGSAQKVSKKSAKGKGKAPQTRKKPNASKKDEDDYEGDCADEAEDDDD